MYTKVITQNHQLAIDLNDLKAQLRIEVSDSSADAELSRKARAAQRHIERLLNRHLLPTVLDTKFHQVLKRHYLIGPVIGNITSVKTRQADETMGTVSANNYEVLHDVDEFLYFLTEPVCYTSAPYNLEIRYNSGLSATAEALSTSHPDIVEAIIILATTLDQQRTITDKWVLSVVGSFIGPYRNEYIL